MLNQNFVWVALAIAIAGNAFYFRDTLIGETKPNRVTFFLWGAAPLVSYFAQRTSGGGIQILYTLTIALMPFAILGASFANKKAYWAITKFDIACGVLSVVALILLLITGNGLLALILSIVADFSAALPTIIKSYKYPETETMIAYALEIISSTLVLLTIHHWVFIDYGFAAYILFMNVLFTSLLVLPKRFRTA
jgi:hypothetical protein